MRLGGRWPRWAAMVVGGNLLLAAAARQWWPAGWSRLVHSLRHPLQALIDGRMNQYLLTLAAVLAIDAAVLGWKRSAVRTLGSSDRSARLDLFWGVLAATGALQILVTFFGFGLFPTVAPWVAVRLDLTGVGAHVPLWMHVVAYLVVYDLVNYWYHRWCHHSRLLWRFHRLHHEPTTFLVVTGNRVHPAEIAIRQWLMLLPILALGTPLAIPVAAAVVLRAVDMLQHSMVPWTYGTVGRWLLFSPVAHRAHHSPLAVHRGTNYGDLFTLWDRCFGTLYRGDVVNAEVGLSGQPRSVAPSLATDATTLSRSEPISASSSVRSGA